MEYDLFKEWLPSITEKKGYYMDGQEGTEAKYPSFMINRALSQYEDCVLMANMMNHLSILDAKLQYDFLVHTVAPKRRFSKWAKATKSDDILTISKAYNISCKKAEEVMALFSAEEMDALRESIATGGKRSTGKGTARP